MTEITRRTFIQLSVLSGAAAYAGLASGCDNPEEARGQYGGYNSRLRPYVNQPEGMTDGVPQWFATTCAMCPAGCGLLVRTMGGRAIKVEGNPAHPVNQGKTCARGQASLQRLYNPNRMRFPAVRPARNRAAAVVDWENALSQVAAVLQTNRGKIAILLDGMEFGNAPAAMSAIQSFAKTAGATLYSHTLIDDAPWRAAAKNVYGRDQLPAYSLDEADVIVSFGGNFLEAWPSPVYYGRLFGDFRQGPRRSPGEHGRFIYIGPRMSMTAAKADRWIPCNPGTEGAVALGILTALGGSGIPAAQAAAISGVSEDNIAAIARRFASAGKRAVAVGGDGLIAQPGATAAFTAVESLNAFIKSQCVGFGMASPPKPEALPGRIADLKASIDSGTVEALLVLGEPNPVFTLPNGAEIAATLDRVPFIAALTPFEDETTAHADILLPIRTFLETWGDRLPLIVPEGSAITGLHQPIIDPKFVATQGPGISPQQWMDTRPLIDILSDLTGHIGSQPPAAAQPAAFENQLTAWSPEARRDALGRGGSYSLQVNPPAPFIARALPPAEFGGPQTPPEPGTFALQLYPHIYWADGRHANLPWLQEIPDPMSMAIWNNWVEINASVAHELGIRTGDIVRITTTHGSIEAPAVPYPGMHPSAIAIPIGQGHSGRGINPLSIADSGIDAVTKSITYNGTIARIEKVKSAQTGYWPDTLVVLEDRPRGQEPEAVKDLIHTTAREWREAKAVGGTQ